MILAIKFTSWSNVLLKLSQFKGKLFEIRLPNSLSRLSEKNFAQKLFFYFSREELVIFCQAFQFCYFYT